MIVGRDVRDHPRLHHSDADRVQPLGQPGQVRILGPAREDLVADDEDGRGDRARLRGSEHAGPAYCSRLVAETGARQALVDQPASTTILLEARHLAGECPRRADRPSPAAADRVRLLRPGDRIG